MLDFEEGADAPLVLGEARGDGVPGGVFEVGDEPGGREDRRHPVVGEHDPVRGADDQAFFGGHPDSGRILHGKVSGRLAPPQVETSRSDGRLILDHRSGENDNHYRLNLASSIQGPAAIILVLEPRSTSPALDFTLDC